MMGSTHLALGALLGYTGLFLTPEYVLAAAVGGLIGGVFPDIDMPFDHRKTLHFPVYYFFIAVPAMALALLIPSGITVFLAYFFFSAAVHSAFDILGCGTEPKPWEANSEEAVYIHYLGRWGRPRRLVRYDGAPEDFLLTLLFGVPAYLLYEGRIALLVLAAIVIGGLYSLIRRRLTEFLYRRWPELF
ncbi:MAG: metal-dependent hydrolase [Candidatus Nanohaloarchaea archaeon]